MSAPFRVLILLLALAPAPAPAASLRQTSDAYLTAFCRTLAAEATEQDVDRVLAYCSDDVVHEDPAVGVRIAGKAAIRDGMLSHVGDYRGTPEQSGLVVLSRLIGRQAVAVEVRETFQVERDGALQTIDRRKLKVLEFHDGRIRRVLDY